MKHMKLLSCNSLSLSSAAKIQYNVFRAQVPLSTICPKIKIRLFTLSLKKPLNGIKSGKLVNNELTLLKLLHIDNGCIVPINSSY
jgi:hypothetical protein